MEIILVRHAVAMERQEFAKTGQEDSLRPITLKGARRHRRMCKSMQKMARGAEVIVTSPLLRARQTAEITSQIYEDLNILEVPELVPSASPSAFLKWVRVWGRVYKKIIVVGHEPHLGELASYLVSGQVQHNFIVKKSGFLSIITGPASEIEKGSGKVLYHVSPKLFMK